MAIFKEKGKYLCSYCGKSFPRPLLADSCRESHDLVYIQMSRENLMRLIQFLYTQERSLLNPIIIRDLKRHAKIKTSRDEDAYLSSMLESDSDE